MDKYVKEIKAYTFPELTGEAKEKAKEWYLNDETLSWELTNNYESDLSCIFPNSDLKVQWSLSYCQGDGVNIYGSVNMEDIFSLPQNAPAYNWINGYLTEKEIRTLKFYMSEYKNEVKIPVNRRYCYCMTDRIDLAEDFQYELENMGIRDIRVSVLEKTERLDELFDEDYTGIYAEIIGIWKEARTDREKTLVKKMFETFTGISLKDYLEKCITTIAEEKHNER